MPNRRRKAAPLVRVLPVRLSLIVLLILAGCGNILYSRTQIIRDVSDLADLNRAAAFSFAIMSDNKGDAPENRPEFARMVSWMEKDGDRFVIGLGDHVKKGRRNEFLPFLRDNRWWRNNFYPNIADGENEFYGKGQGDWAAGGIFLRDAGLTANPNVTPRENGCEYYARIPVGEYTVHLIQLHFPDTPGDDEIAFPRDSREYLAATLRSIPRSPRNLIVVCAHSRWGSWLGSLSRSQRRLVMERSDLVLSATTHYFERIILPGYEHSGALVLNTGSITWPRGCPPGYIRVHVLENPVRLVARYVRADRDTRELERYGALVWMKVSGGPVMAPRFRDK